MNLVENAILRSKELKVEAGDIRIKSSNKISVSGMELEMSNQSFKDLLKFAGLNNKTIKNFNQNFKEGTGYNILSELTKRVAENGNSKLSLYVGDNLIVERIARSGDNKNPITPEGFAGLLDIANNNNNLEIRNTFVENGGTKIGVNLIHPDHISLKFAGENISLGKRLDWDMFEGLTVSDLAYRLVCSNGMTRIEPMGAVNIKSANPSQIYKDLFADFNNESRKEKLIYAYEKGVINAMTENLSVREYENIINVISPWMEKDEMLINKFIGDEMWKLDYSNRNIDLEKLTSSQKANCPTPINAWDAINMLTNLSSHDYRSNVSASAKNTAQGMAGKLLRGTWDMRFQVSNLPTYRVEQRMQDAKGKLILN